jgi:hypothetical protein
MGKGVGQPAVGGVDVLYRLRDDGGRVAPGRK